jgi:hypothetical protein
MWNTQVEGSTSTLDIDPSYDVINAMLTHMSTVYLDTIP